MCNSCCDIENSLSTNASCGIFCEEGELGNITVYPQNSCYLKGEKVHVWFEGTNPDYDFCNWLSDPPDIYSANNPLPYTVVQIKDQPQSLIAFCQKNKVTLTVECDYASFLMPGNRLEVPSGANVAYTIVSGEQVPWRYTIEYPVGSSIEVSAIPADGYIIDWKGNSACVGGCKGIRYYQNSINVMMVGSVYLKPCATHINDYDFDFHTMTISAVYGEGILLSGGYNYSQGGCDIPLFPYASALSYGRFRVAVVPESFKSLAYWYCSTENLYCPSEVAEAVFPINGNRTHSANAVLVDKVFLITPDPLGLKYIDHVHYYENNMGGIAKIITPLLYSPSSFDPYPLGWNPLPYGSTHPNEFWSVENLYECPECNAVELEPIPCLGSEFLYWEVSPDGDVWIPVPRNPINPNLTVYMNYFGSFDPIYYPGDIHIPNGGVTLYVRPVFKLSCDFVCGYCSGPDGRDVIIDMYENPEVLLGVQMYPGPAPDCSKYVTNQQNHPAHYEKEDLLPFNVLQCHHGTLNYPHDGWAIEDGIAECYDAVEQAYSGTINVTSVYRCPVKNSSVNGSLTSKHLLGKAFDFDQPSSEANWRVAKTAYECNNNNEILLYYYENGNKKSVSFYKVSDENEKPWEKYIFEHGHVGIVSGD
ncbi:MAG: D-Ala-D-Ala carboxypeptidase family metallohydrolase [Candidatus Hydrogenedens sp.]